MLTNSCKHKKENSKDQSEIENRKTETLERRGKLVLQEEQ